jgi:hypothetical protein
MGVSFAIIAHDDPQQLRKLLNELKGYPVGIHIDRTRNLEEFDCCLKEMDAMHSFVKDRIRVRWGGYSVVQAMILAGNQVSKSIRNDDHIVFLSGHCFPLKPMSKLEEYLDSCNWKQHIRAFGATNTSAFSITRWRRRHWFDLMHLPIKSRFVFRILRKLLYFITFFLKVKSKPGILTAIGSQWISMTKECFDDVTKMIIEKKFSYLNNGFAPDEMVFHTAVYSTKWRFQTRFGQVESNPAGEISKVANLHVLDRELSGNFNFVPNIVLQCFAHLYFKIYL